MPYKTARLHIKLKYPKFLGNTQRKSKGHTSSKNTITNKAETDKCSCNAPTPTPTTVAKWLSLPRSLSRPLSPVFFFFFPYFLFHTPHISFFYILFCTNRLCTAGTKCGVTLHKHISSIGCHPILLTYCGPAPCQPLTLKLIISPD